MRTYCSQLVGLCIMGVILIPGCTPDHTLTSFDTDAHGSELVLAKEGTAKVPIIDACEINLVFCDADGNSDVPDYRFGFAHFNRVADAMAILTVKVNGSIASETHYVKLCPGAVSDERGFTDCFLVGVFETNVKGHGSFQYLFEGSVPSAKVVALNVPVFDTVLANCPEEPNADCVPALLQ